MFMVINTYGLPLLPQHLARPLRKHQLPAAAATRVFPQLFRLYDRRSGQAVREAGRHVEVFGTDLAAVRDALLHNRDPHLFEVRIETPGSSRPV